MMSYIRDGFSSELWVVVSFMLLVLGVCVYDFLNTKNWVQVTATDRNEEVFENRNQMYGAYRLRKNSSKSMLLILGAVLFSLGSTAGAFYAFKEPGEKKENSTANVPTDMFTPDEQDKKDNDVPPPPPPPEIPPEQKTVQFIPPKVVTEIVEQNLTNEDLNNQNIDDENKEGKDDPFAKELPKDDGPKETEKKEDVIYDIVEEAAAYPGGAQQYIARVLEYPPTAVEQELQGKCFLKFVVSDKGVVSDVKVLRGVPDCSECDEAAVKAVKSMKTWTPAKNGGTYVSSRFTLPVTFKLN
jgi:periplasmic protein TonB